MNMNGYEDCLWLTWHKYNFPSERLRLYDNRWFFFGFFAKLAHYSVYLDNDFACKNRSSKNLCILYDFFVRT